MISIANPAVGDEEADAVRTVIESGRLTDGPEVRRFEEGFADFCGTRHGVATSNGTTALQTALEALGIGAGDRVLTTPFSFVASANAIRFSGAEPVFADVDPETYNLDPDAAAEVVRSRDVDAILAVHLYGLPADVGPLADIAETHDIPLVEDAAQAHGAEYDGRRVGSLGDVACFSFYPTKNMTTGEGGMITTDRDDVAERARSFVNHGRSAGGSYEHARLGHNFRMTSIAAAIGRTQLRKLPEYVEARRENAQRFTDRFATTPLSTPTEPPNRRHVFHQYTVRTERRDELASFLDDRGIGTSVYYPTPIHRQPVYESVNHRAPVAERASNEVLSLPVHPTLTERDRDRITDSVVRFFQNDD